MSEAPALDFRRKFLKLLGYAIITAVIATVVWGVLALGGRLFGEAKHLRCQSNLQSLIGAMTMYRDRNGGQLPPHLRALLPLQEGRYDKFQCPSDPNGGTQGCRPAWLRRDDEHLGTKAFVYADLDGPGYTPDKADDSFPCSYLYVANVYPFPLPDRDPDWTWRDEFNRLVKEHGNEVPLIRCYYHLPEKYKSDPSMKGGTMPDETVEPTYNVTYKNVVADDLKIREYPLLWRADRRFFKKSP